MDMLTTLCNIIQQLSDVEMYLNNEDKDKTFFAPNNKAFEKNQNTGFDFTKSDFDENEKGILKRLIQTLIIGGNQKILFEDLDCNDRVYTNFNSEKIGIQCKMNPKTGKTNFFLYRADWVQVGISNSAPKIIKDEDFLASNGNLLVVNNLLLF